MISQWTNDYFGSKRPKKPCMLSHMDSFSSIGPAAPSLPLGCCYDRARLRCQWQCCSLLPAKAPPRACLHSCHSKSPSAIAWLRIICSTFRVPFCSPMLDPNNCCGLIWLLLKKDFWRLAVLFTDVGKISWHHHKWTLDIRDGLLIF